ncbi:transposase [Desulfosarcina widdelii]|uniref:Transposase n=2 Tax=Desulfosarcina TaxID=2299 RepID=A0A5K7ZB25_9BACT|nr:transposase [Desulfosarcina widdelii]
MDQLQDKGRIETLIRSLSRFSEKALLILSGQSDVSAHAMTIGPALVFDRLWKESGIQDCINELLKGRKFEFDVERAIFLTVLHRLMVSGSDRFCEKWQRDHLIPGTETLALHHLYRAMTFLGEVVPEEHAAGKFGPRRNKDLIEEMLFYKNRDLFSNLDLVFFDTTSIYFQGQGGEHFGRRGFSKDHRPDLFQMVVGAVLDETGRPICCEMWPGNTTDVTTLLPELERLQSRFSVGECCIVADRGMISAGTLEKLDEDETPYILGTRMRKVKRINTKILTRAGRYSEVYPESADRRKPAPLKVKEVIHEGTRYIVCLNERQARKDAADREAILESLKRKLKQGATSLVGNRGYRRYLKVAKDSTRIDPAKVKADARFDGKWVLTTNTKLPADKVALKYKELWRVERVFRDMKSLLETRPVYHQKDENIAGHVFCSFLALVLRKELDQRLADNKHRFEWSDIKQDLKALKQVEIEENGKCFAIRTECKGVCGKVFQSVRVALPPTIKAVA